jgi:hypothetical protein
VFQHVTKAGGWIMARHSAPQPPPAPRHGPKG